MEQIQAEIPREEFSPDPELYQPEAEKPRQRLMEKEMKKDGIRCQLPHSPSPDQELEQ